MIIHWDVYEIKCDCTELHGVKLRGRIRKFSIEHEISCLIENASDEENIVRFALQTGTVPTNVEDFIRTLVPQVRISRVLTNIPNPILSKLKVNDLSRYEL